MSRRKPVVIRLSTQNSTTTAAWQSDSSDLSRSEAGLISAHWTTIRRALPHPRAVWRWGETGLPQRVLHRWKHAGLIECVNERDRLWRSSVRLWCHVIGRAGDEETVGAAAHAQELLPTGLDPLDPDEMDTRVVADTSSPRPSRRRRQVSLTGETVPRRVVQTQHEPDWETVNEQKGVHGEDGRKDAAEHPGQSRLSTFEDYDRSNWDVTTPWFRSSVTAPTGTVY